jgi:hypothetical protein
MFDIIWGAEICGISGRAQNVRPNCWILIIQRKQAIGPNLGKIQPRVRSLVFVRAFRLRGKEKRSEICRTGRRCLASLCRLKYKLLYKLVCA